MTSPSKTFEPHVTRALLVALFGIWLITVFAGGTDQVLPALSDGPDITRLLAFGADLHNLTIGQGQYWRLISSCFLHIGALHIMFNAWALFVFGPDLEKQLGHGRYLFLFVASGICGALLSAQMNPEIVSAGASGAIFGMVGAIWSILLRRKAPPAAIQQIVWIVGLNFAWGLRPGSHVDNWAHGGGLVSGFVMGAVLPSKNQTRAAVGRWLDVCLGVVAVLALVYGLGSAALNARAELGDPGKAALTPAKSVSGDYVIGAPSGWERGEDKHWDVWRSPSRAILMATELDPEDGRQAATLSGATQLTKDLMDGILGERKTEEMTVLSRTAARIDGSPAFRIRCFARLPDERSFRLTAYWTRTKGEYFVVSLFTPADVSMPDELLRRVAESIRPVAHESAGRANGP
jgi:rhomboid protease GluP